MAALGNAPCDGMARCALVTKSFRRALEPVVSIEEFGV